MPLDPQNSPAAPSPHSNCERNSLVLTLLAMPLLWKPPGRFLERSYPEG
eukprot:CAMPEP_0181332268 /NCGR_PEP_ID=MMETSP1101-20121128/24994_1 /TAXON_ID=46948 /ORGANISM="Rhodomonas abbreviata, Strain Caron Lab Isolate" /LENGTH=48 /DNA_ID= /DNA_START= /DNA_END= /DNA_ORIENTATION=